MRKTLTWILYILMGVQIVFGCVYFAGNLGTEQQFYENIGSFLPMWAISLSQLALAAASTWYMLGKIGFRENKYLRGYVCAFLLTVPFLLQMHMARLVWSAALSAFLWLLGLTIETVEKGLSGKRVVWLLAACVLYGLICPGGIWPGGVLLLTIVFRKRKHVFDADFERQKGKKGAAFGFVFAVFLAAGVTFAVNSGLNTAFPQERRVYRESDFGMAVLSRLVWPNFGKSYGLWTDEIKKILSEETAVEISRRPELTGEEFYFPLVDTYGKKEATELCLEMGRDCLNCRTKETVFEAGRDLKDYFLLPFTIEKNLKGEGVSLTAWNYGRMRGHTPMLVKYYYRYGIFELPVLLLGSFLLWFSRGIKHIQFWKKRTVGQNYILFVLALHTFWCTVRSNFPIDYKTALPIVLIWYLASVGGVMEEGNK